MSVINFIDAGMVCFFFREFFIFISRTIDHHNQLTREENRMEKKVPEIQAASDIVHVMTNQYIRVVNYDKRTGQVSYSLQDRDSVYTCYDYELVSMKGMSHLRSVLSAKSNGHNSQNVLRGMILG